MNSIEDMKEAYNKFINISYIQVVKIKNKLDTDLQNISVNFIFLEGIIGEVQISFTEKPPQYDANHFVYELERVDSPSQFLQQVVMYCGKLAENN